MNFFIKMMIDEWNKLIEAKVKTKGWSEKSAQKFGEKIGVKPTDKGFFEACTKKMKGKVYDPDSFCASIKDTAFNSTYWRGKGKSDKQVKKDTKSHPLK